MKKMSKILALTLALAMLLCLCACGGSGTRSASSADFETRLREAQQKMNNLESMHMDMNMDVTMELSIMGQSQSMDMRAYYVMDVQTNPNRSKLVMTSSSMGQTQEMTMYTDENNMVYVSNDGRNWQRQSSQSVDTSTMDPDTMLQLMLKNTSGFRETGKEIINGSQATVYSGELSGDYVKEAFDMTGLGSSLGSLLGCQGRLCESYEQQSRQKRQHIISLAHQPTALRTASSTRSAWNGLTIKSRAPAWIASITIAC